MVEVTVSLIILSARSHEGSLLSLLVLVGGFHSVQTCWLSPHFSCHHTQSFCCYGVVGFLNHLVSLYIVSPGYGFVYTIDVCVVGYDGYYAKGLALRLISISWLCFISALPGLIGKTTRVIPCVFWVLFIDREEPLLLCS
jgi:hypothetical protein